MTAAQAFTTLLPETTTTADTTTVADTAAVADITAAVGTTTVADVHYSHAPGPSQQQRTPEQKQPAQSPRIPTLPRTTLADIALAADTMTATDGTTSWPPQKLRTSQQ